MPGVLQVEAMAQVGGLVMLTPEVGGSKDSFFFGGVDACRFRKPVLPGDTLVMKVELVKLNKRFGMAKMKGQAFVGDKLACEVRRLILSECCVHTFLPAAHACIQQLDRLI